MKRRRIRACVCLACAALLVAVPLIARAIPSQGKGPQKAARAPAAPRPRTLVIPETLIGGAPATLAVLDSAGRLLSGVMVDLSGRPSVTTDATGRASFISPPGPGVLVAWTGNHAVTATATIEQNSSDVSGNGTGSAPATDTLSVASYPQFLSLYDRFEITGSGFRGLADANHVFLADQPCLVIAASPVALVVLPGTHIPIGPAVLRVNVLEAQGAAPTAAANAPAGQPAPAAQPEVAKPVSVISLEVTGPQQTMHPGAQGMLTVQARGTAERVQVELRNGSPAVVQLTGGNVQRITTSGGDQNIAQIPVKFLTSGDYTITAHLLADAAAPAAGT